MNEPLYTPKLQFGLQKIEVTHDGARNFMQDGYFRIRELSRPVIDDTVRPEDKTTRAGQGDLRVAAHVRPIHNIGPRPEALVCFEVTNHVVIRGGRDVLRVVAIVHRSKDLDSLGTDTEAQLKSRDTQVDAISRAVYPIQQEAG